MSLLRLFWLIFTDDGRGSSGIGRGKSNGLAEGILLPAEAVDSNRSRPKLHTPVSISTLYWDITLYWPTYYYIYHDLVSYNLYCRYSGTSLR